MLAFALRQSTGVTTALDVYAASLQAQSLCNFPQTTCASLPPLPPPGAQAPNKTAAALAGRCGEAFTAATAGLWTCQSSSSPLACMTVQQARCPCLQMRRAGQALAELNGQQKAVALGGSSKARYREAQVGAANECARRLENHSLAELQDEIAVLQQQLEVNQQVQEVAVSSVHLTAAAARADKRMCNSPPMCMHRWLMIACVCFTHASLPCHSLSSIPGRKSSDASLVPGGLKACCSHTLGLGKLRCWRHAGSQAHVFARLSNGNMPCNSRHTHCTLNSAPWHAFPSVCLPSYHSPALSETPSFPLAWSRRLCPAGSVCIFPEDVRLVA